MEESSLRFPVSPGKAAGLRARIARLGIDLAAVEETVARGSGKGGQKRNKTSNAVRLTYAPLGLEARCGSERSLGLNRFLALRELVERIEMRVDPAASPKLREIEKARKRKGRRRARAKEKYG